MAPERGQEASGAGGRDPGPLRPGRGLRHGGQARPGRGPLPGRRVGLAGTAVEKPPVVVLSGVRWGFLWQRHQTVATLFARAGYPTVFVETTGLANPGSSALPKVWARVRRTGADAAGDGGPTVYPPLVLPPTLRVFRAANRRLLLPRVARDLEGAVGRNPVVVAYPPTRTTLDLISALDPRLVLYDCADDYEHFPGVPKDISATQRELLARGDLVSCTSRPLLEKARRDRKSVV